jgi:hypothetical protein
MWRQAVTHIRESRWFELMYTLQGKARPTWHVRFSRQSTYAWCTLPVGTPRTWLPFVKSSIMKDRATALEKKCSWHNPQHAGWPIHGSVPSFSPEAAIEAVGVKSLCRQPATRLTEPISPACDRYVHYLIAGATSMEVLAFDIPLPDLPNQLSPLFT